MNEFEIYEAPREELMNALILAMVALKNSAPLNPESAERHSIALAAVAKALNAYSNINH